MPHSYIEYKNNSVRMSDSEALLILAVIVLVFRKKQIRSDRFEAMISVWRGVQNIECMGMMNLELDKYLIEECFGIMSDCLSGVLPYLKSRVSGAECVLTSDRAQEIITSARMGDYPMKNKTWCGIKLIYDQFESLFVD